MCSTVPKTKTDGWRLAGEKYILSSIYLLSFYTTSPVPCRTRKASVLEVAWVGIQHQRWLCRFLGSAAAIMLILASRKHTEEAVGILSATFPHKNQPWRRPRFSSGACPCTTFWKCSNTTTFCSNILGESCTTCASRMVNFRKNTKVPKEKRQLYTVGCRMTFYLLFKRTWSMKRRSCIVLLTSRLEKQKTSGRPQICFSHKYVVTHFRQTQRINICVCSAHQVMMDANRAFTVHI